MIKGSENQSLYREYYEIIQEKNTKLAYSYLVGWASTLKSYECFPSSHGRIKDFRFVRDENWEFAFIPNQRWLLFYFRKPCLKQGRYSREKIIAEFPDAHETNLGEFTLKISNVEMAMQLSAYIDSQAL